MARGVRLLAMCLGCCVAGLTLSPSFAFGETVETSPAETPSSGSSAGAPGLFGSPLVVPGEEGLDGGQQAREQHEVLLANPEAVAERAYSRTAFEGLGGAGAVSLAERTFGIQSPTWTPPGDQEGAHITKYLGETGAQELSSSGQHLLLESSIPLRSAVGSGQLAPTSLTLHEEGGSYEPVNPVVPVSISKAPGGGVSLPLGISVAPVQAASAEGSSVVGNKVVYPGTATDTDFMVEPVPGGVEASWQLLSEQSSQDNSLVFTLPQGASLQVSKTGVGAAEVVKEGQVLATIPPASATEANGTRLSVSYSVSGNTLATHVDLSGSVAFPVMVDPLVEGYYGQINGAATWAGWQTYTSCGCFSIYYTGSYWQADAPIGEPINSYAEWFVYAPGGGTEGGAGISRVDITGVSHWSGTNDSALEAGIGLSYGNNPVWTFNGTAGAQGASPLNTEAIVSQPGAAFCAQGAGGYDGGEQPLCDSNYAGEYFSFQDVIGWEADTTGSAIEMTGAAVAYLDNVAPNEVAIHNIPPNWVKAGPTNAYIFGHDQGVGVQALSLEIPPGYTSEGHPFFDEEYSCGANGFAGCPAAASTKAVAHLNEIATGSYNLGVYAYDATGNVREQQPDPKLYVDHTGPVFKAFTGSLKEASGGVIGSGNYVLNFGAEDGSTGAPQSGVRSIKLYVDGSKVDELNTGCAEPIGNPASGCYALSGSWTMEGQKYGAGAHTITATAVDWTGNESSSEAIHVTVNEASYQPVGPGAVNLKTGDYKLSASDVSIAGAGGELTLSRSYDSRRPSQGVTGPLGPQWALSLPDAAGDGEWQSMQVLPNGSAVVTAAIGSKVTFAVSGSTYTSPAGYQTLVLSKSSSTEYRLTDGNGDATIFTRASSAEEEAPVFIPSGVVQATGAGGLNAMTYLFAKTTEGIIEPTAVLAPYPSTLKCSEKLTKKEELVAGCRALEFFYSTATKEKIGESKAEWGAYKGRLAEVKFVAYEPIAKKMAAPITVAEYAYDKLGRLRAEWNPQVSMPLETIYGYDPEGHVTAVTAPGQQPWAFTYGTTASDSNPGRLLKVMRPPVSTAAWSGTLPISTEAPKLTGSAVVGNKMSVSEGKWSGAPVAHGYRWTRCAGSSCTVIAGANNQSYTPVSADLGDTLVAEVTATNNGGSVVAPSAASTAVVSKAGAFTQSVGSASLNAVSCIPGTTDCVLSDSTGRALYATNVSVTSAATWKSWTGPGTSPSEAVECPTTTLCLLADGSLEGHGGSLYDATSLGGAWGLAYTPSYGVDAISCPSSSFCVDGQDGGGYFRYSTTPASTSWTLEQQGTASMNDVFCLSISFCAIVDSTGSVHIANTTTQIESSTWTSTSVNASVALNGVACTSTASCLAVDGAGNVLNLTISGTGTATVSKHNIDGTNNLTAITCTTSSTCVTVDNVGNVFVSKNNGETWTKQYALSDKLTSVSCASSTLCATADTTGNLTAFNPAGGTATEGEHTSPAAGSTVDYNIPLTGTGLTSMSKAEVEKWGQKIDVPLEGTAIFPPDKPQSWPATEYVRATIYYLDSSERTVNVSTSAGGISTTEYDKNNNVTRALTVDNRARALKEAKTAEASENLDTKSSYNTVGTELESTLGPEHEIKLQGTAEPVKARKQVRYTYNEEGAPSGGPYRLVTKTVETAKVAGTEKEPRTVTNSYAGQEGLGWKLHAPTSTTTNPEGLNLTHTTAFSTTSGMVTETKMPSTSGTGNSGAHNSQIIYYTPSTEASVVICQNHPQWANLPCQTQPVHQPEVSGLTEVPVTTFTYNIWDEPEITKSTSGASTRTQTDTYDGAARLATKEIASSTGSTLPAVKYKYNTISGFLEKQSTGSGTEEKTITSEYNALGQLAAYTDAEANTATYEYEKENDARLTKISDAKGSQTFAYNTTTGLIKELTDSTAGKFTAIYDAEGNIISEELPNGMSANSTLNPVGEATGLVYKKTTHCTEKCEWYTDSVTPSIHGQWLNQTSTLSTNNYSYDETGRLTQVQDTPTGKECATRSYIYDADGNRTSLKRTPPAGGKCSTEGGETETHSYDTADRLADTGTTYNPFEDILTLPATDAGGTKLTSTYYADGQLASQEQGEQTIGYQLDPARRTRETVATGKVTKNTVSHYDGPGSTPSWTAYPPSGEWTRDIPGISDSLDAVQYNTETPVLQIANLHGDVVGEVLDSETATGLKSSQDTTEYGVPTTSEPLKYAWLGAGEFPTELPSGTIDIGARSYVPQLGRFLQPDPQPGGSADGYAYTNGDPLNESDPSGQWSLNETSGGLSAVGTGEGEQLAGGVGIAAGAIMPPPVNEAIEAAFEADPPWDQVTAGDEEYEEYEEEYEEGEEEYASYDHSGGSGHEESHIEGGVLYQPLGAEALSSNSTGRLTGLAILCSKELHSSRRMQPHGNCMQYASLFGELKKFGGELIHGAKKVSRSIVRHALAYIKRHIKSITNIVAGCDRGAIEGGVGGGIGGAIFAPFVGPETIPIGAAGGGAGGCIVGGFAAELGV